MEKQYKVGIVGATGMVGQRFVTLLENHPWFKLTVLAASGRSAGKTYEEAVGPRWAMTSPMPESVKKMVVLDASKVEEVASQVDFIFCAVNMPKDEIKALEEAYAKAECPVVSNNSANRFTPDVPMVVPEINADHIEIIPAQRKRLGTKRGFIAVKSNCSLQSYVPALHPLMKDFGVSIRNGGRSGHSSSGTADAGSITASASAASIAASRASVRISSPVRTSPARHRGVDS